MGYVGPGSSGWSRRCTDRHLAAAPYDAERMPHLAQKPGEPRPIGFTGLLAGSDRDDLLRLGHDRRYPRGATLMLQGARPSIVVIILEGWAKVVVSTADGRDVLLTVVGVGDLSGHWEAVTGTTCAATVTTLEPCRVRAITAVAFVTFLEAHPRVTLALLRHTITGYQQADRRRTEAGTLDAAHRLGSVLLELAHADRHIDDDHAPVELGIPISQEEIAGLISASRQSVARALTTLRQRGFIATGRRSITVRDVAGLRRFTDQI
jgi:CRP/FNR family cyclic AMP-dependent transcriptional regulator